jgi:hypothetical protein
VRESLRLSCPSCLCTQARVGKLDPYRFFNPEDKENNNNNNSSNSSNSSSSNSNGGEGGKAVVGRLKIQVNKFLQLSKIFLLKKLIKEIVIIRGWIWDIGTPTKRPVTQRPFTKCPVTKRPFTKRPVTECPGYKMSRLPNVHFTKRPEYKTSRTQNVQFS